MCGINAIEDQMHMLVKCEAYQHERNMMFHTLNTITDEVSSMTSNEKERLTLWLLSNVQCDQPVREFLDAAFTKRSSWIGTLIIITHISFEMMINNMWDNGHWYVCSSTFLTEFNRHLLVSDSYRYFTIIVSHTFHLIFVILLWTFNPQLLMNAYP